MKNHWSFRLFYTEMIFFLHTALVMLNQMQPLADEETLVQNILLFSLLLSSRP